MGRAAYTWVGQLTHGQGSLHMGGAAYTWVGQLTHGWGSLHMGGAAYTWAGQLIHGQGVEFFAYTPAEKYDYLQASRYSKHKK